MQALVLALIIAVTIVEYFKKNGLLPGFSALLPEVFGAIILIYVVIAGVRTRFRDVRAAYWMLFGLLLFTALCGVVVNSERPGPIVAGLRTYLRSIPLFFLPAVYIFSQRQIRTQMRLLLGICLLQVPISILQRTATIARGGMTGDETSGTLLISSILSIFLICALSLLTAFYRRKQISGTTYGVLFLLLVFPTCINETKGTLLLLPVALVVTFLTVSKPGARIKNFLVAISLLSVFAAIFVPVYDYLIQTRKYPTTISGYFTEEGRLQRYVSKKAQLGTDDKVGRLDAIVVPVQELAKDPVKLAFGLGVGNVSDSTLGEQFVGHYFELFKPFVQTLFAKVFLEMGLLGMLLVMCLYWCIYKDSKSVAASDPGIYGSLAAGWTGVVAVIALSTFYKELASFQSLSFLFWYLSGLIAAQRMRLGPASRRP